MKLNSGQSLSSLDHRQKIRLRYSTEILVLGLHLCTRPQLFKRRIALSNGSICIQRITQLVSQILIRWLVIYLVDSTIQLLTNWGQDLSTCIISQLKKPLSICQSDWRVRNSKQISGNSLNPLEAQNKDLSAASQTSLTKIRLHLWCRLATLKQWHIQGRGHSPPPYF